MRARSSGYCKALHIRRNESVMKFTLVGAWAHIPWSNDKLSKHVDPVSDFFDESG
jgi:hypothetical protein